MTGIEYLAFRHTISTASGILNFKVMPSRSGMRSFAHPMKRFRDALTDLLRITTTALPPAVAAAALGSIAT
jgi:hypothetical protein